MITFIRKHETALTALGLLLVAVIGFARLEGVTNANHTLIVRANNETINRQVESCKTAREFRKSFPDILRQLANPPTELNTDVDFTKVPGFKNLDEATRAYLISLGALLSMRGGGSSSFLEQTADNYERDFPVPNCQELRVELERKLKAQRGEGS